MAFASSLRVEVRLAAISISASIAIFCSFSFCSGVRVGDSITTVFCKLATTIKREIRTMAITSII